MSRELFIVLCTIIAIGGFSFGTYNIGLIVGRRREREAYQDTFRRVLAIRARTRVSGLSLDPGAGPSFAAGTGTTSGNVA